MSRAVFIKVMVSPTREYLVENKCGDVFFSNRYLMCKILIGILLGIL